MISGRGIMALVYLMMMVVGTEFILRGVNHNPVCGGINPDIVINNYVGRLNGTVVKHDP